MPDENPEHELREVANSIHVRCAELMARMEFAKTIDAILALSDQANKYFNDEKPWNLFKEGKSKEGRCVLFTVLEVVRRVAMELYPFTPKMAQKIWYQLGYDDDISTLGEARSKEGFFDLIPRGQKLRLEGPVFKRIEDPDAKK